MPLSTKLLLTQALIASLPREVPAWERDPFSESKHKEARKDRAKSKKKKKKKK